VPRTLLVEILGDASDLSKELGIATSDSQGFGGSLLGTAAKVTAVTAAVAGTAAAIKDMTNAAAEDQAEQARLEAALVAAGVATGDYATKVDDAIKAGQEKAFSDTQTREALQSLVTATGDLDSATGLLATAQDVARFAGVDLATAADAVAKAQAGQDGPLRKLLPGLEKGATASDTLAAATAAAAGSADAYAESAAGMQEKGSDAFGELSETIGQIFLPIIEAILPALIPIMQAFGELITAILPLLTPLFAGLADVLKLVSDAIVIVVEWVTKLVDWLVRAMDKVREFLDKINPLNDIHLPSFPSIGGSAAAAQTGVGPSQLAAGGGGGVTINLYTGADTIAAEQAVLRALRRLQRLNGGRIP
jgi:hypothetical protein